MLPCQSFKTLRLFDMVLIFEYRGVPHPVASPFYPVPSRRSREDCLRPLRRRLSIPHAVIRPCCFPLLSPPVRYDRRGEDCGASRCLLQLAVGRVGRAVSSRRGYHASVAAACPMRASDRLPCRPFISPPLVRSRMASPLARSRHARRFISPRPSTRETGSRTGRMLARR